MSQVKDVAVLFSRLKKNSHVFSGAHDIYTPQELTEEVLMNIPNLHDGKTFLVLFNVEFIFTLVYTYGVNSKNITLYSDHSKKTSIARSMGCGVITSLEQNMDKFDVVVGNPPFGSPRGDSSTTKKSDAIYQHFFSTATKIADVVCMVLPDSSHNKIKKLVNHNVLVNKHAQQIVDCTNQFNISIKTMYVIWDKSKSASAKLNIGNFDITEIMPDRNRLPSFKRGDHYLYKNKANHPGVYTEPASDRIKCIGSITKNVGFHWVNPSETKANVKQFSAKYLVVMRCKAERFSGNLSDAFLVENDSTICATVDVGVWEFSNKSDAEKLVEWLNSKDFKELCSNNPLIAGNTKTLRLMPSYE